jgi:uncharacterized protein
LGTTSTNGNRDAHYNLGLLYSEGGKGLKKDFEKAAEWFRKAAEQGDVEAQCNLGVMFAEGIGVARDYEKSMEWLVKAADQGDETAQGNLRILLNKMSK